MIESILNALGQSHELKEEEDIGSCHCYQRKWTLFILNLPRLSKKRYGRSEFCENSPGELAIGTMAGSARLMESSELDPRITGSGNLPNGTTQAALESFSEDDP